MQGEIRGFTLVELAVTLGVVAIVRASATPVSCGPLRRHPAGATGPEAGFSLVELMVTVAVLAIVAVMAIPSFTALVNGNRLTSAANETLAIFQSARMEAIKANRRSVACLSANPNAAAPSCTTGTPAGWIVFTDLNRDGQFTAGEKLLRAGSLPSGVQVRGSNSLAGKVIFRADGMARTGTGDLLTATVDMCLPTTEPRQNVRHVSIGSGSRLSIQRADGGGGCGIPSDTP
jgi:type IV fimbrial biogenesis protein FimT